MTGIVKTETKDQGFVITPEGEVAELQLSKTSGAEGTERVAFSYQTVGTGTYMISIYNTAGEAIFIQPVYFSDNSFPFLPDLFDLKDKENTVVSLLDLNQAQDELLTLINLDRQNNGAQKVRMENDLNMLAQSRAEEIVNEKRFSHTNLNNQTVNDQRVNYSIKTFVNENLTLDKTVEFGEYGLMLSGAHRQNIINPEWTKVGLGIDKFDEHNLIIVQLFTIDPINAANLDYYREHIINKINTARLNQRQNALIANLELNAIAQEWSERMARDQFTGHTDSTGNSINDLIRGAGVSQDVLSLFIGVSNFNNADQLIGSESEFTESGWTRIGVGIAQGNFGDIQITLLYSK
jgi:uncharacterized protein YkwD